MTRRDLMRYFGAGAVIAPVAVTAPPVQARIIEPPKVELIESKLIESGDDVIAGLMRKNAKVGVTVHLRELSGGPTYEFRADGYIAGLQREVYDVSVHSDSFRRFLPADHFDMDIKVCGVHSCRVIP